MTGNAPRYLVVAPTWVGDMVMAQSLFMTLNARAADVHIDVLAPDWTRPLVERMPQLNGAIGSPFQHGELRFFQRRRLGHALRSNRYSEAFVLPGSLKAALVPWFANIPVRTGYVGEQRYGLLNDIRKLDKRALPMTVQRFAALGHPADMNNLPPPPTPRLEPAANAHTATRESLNIAHDGAPVLALAPGAEFGPSKRWPEAHFVAVAKQRMAQGWQVWLFGSENDRPVTAAINKALQGRALDLAGRTKLEQAIDLLYGCSAAVTNDSGLMHVAAALGVPVVAIFGSTSPGSTPPLSDKAISVSIDLDCRPCFKRECPLNHLNCLNNLAPERVTVALDELAPTGQSSTQ